MELQRVTGQRTLIYSPCELSPLLIPHNELHICGDYLLVLHMLSLYKKMAGSIFKADSLMQKSAIILTEVHYSSNMYFKYYVLIVGF